VIERKPTRRGEKKPGTSAPPERGNVSRAPKERGGGGGWGGCVMRPGEERGVAGKGRIGVDEPEVKFTVDRL